MQEYYRFKKKGTSGNELSDYRPISILPALSKIMENIIKFQLEDHLVNLSLINSHQFGFRKNHSTNTLLLNMTDFIRRSLDKNNPCLLVLLDLTKAFESVNHNKLICKLHRNFNFSRLGCKLISSFLCNISQFVVNGSICSETKTISSGVPQGSILGPVLFMIYANDIVNCIRNSNVYIFADDIQLCSVSNAHTYYDCSSKINDDLGRISNWANENYIKINPRKTQAMAFGRVHDNSTPSIFLNGHCVPLSNSAKCLGVTIDSNLKFSNHINNVIAKVGLTLRKLYSLSCFLPFQVRYRLAHAVLMPHMLYCMEVYSGTNASLIKECQMCFNRIIRFVYNLQSRDHVSEYTLQFIGCSFLDFIKIRICFLFYKIIKYRQPLHMADEYNFLRTTRSTQIQIESFSTSTYELSFHNRVTKVYNSLPSNLKLFSQSAKVFKKSLSAHFESSNQNR